MLARWIVAASLLGEVLSSTSTPRAVAQSGQSCDDLTQQIAAHAQHLDELEQRTQPTLMSASQLIAIIPQELAVAEANQVPGLSPELARSGGAISAQVAAQIDAWRAANTDTSSDAYLQDLGAVIVEWKGHLAILEPVRNYAFSLTALTVVWSQLDEILADATAEEATLSALKSDLENCSASGSN